MKAFIRLGDLLSRYEISDSVKYCDNILQVGVGIFSRYGLGPLSKLKQSLRGNHYIQRLGNLCCLIDLTYLNDRLFQYDNDGMSAILYCS